MITVIPANMGLVWQVLNALWSRGIEEAKCYGIDTKERLFGHLMSFPSYKLDAICIDGHPVVIFGVYRQENKHYTWMLATERMREIGVFVSRYLRHYAAEWRDMFPGHQAILCSMSQHPDTDRWFKMLGWEPEAVETNPGMKRYILKCG